MALENGMIQSVCEPTRWREASAAIEYALERGKLCQLATQRLFENQESRKNNPSVDFSHQHEADVDAVILAARAWHDATTKVLLASHSAAHIPYDSLKSASPFTVFDSNCFLKVTTEKSSFCTGQKTMEFASALVGVKRADAPHAPASQVIQAVATDVDSENDSVPITLTSDSDQATDFDCSGSDASAGSTDDGGDAHQRRDALHKLEASAAEASQPAPVSNEVGGMPQPEGPCASCPADDAAKPSDLATAHALSNETEKSFPVVGSSSTDSLPGGSPSRDALQAVVEPSPVTVAASSDDPSTTSPTSGEASSAGEAVHLSGQLDSSQSSQGGGREDAQASGGKPQPADEGKAEHKSGDGSEVHWELGGEGAGPGGEGAAPGGESGATAEMSTSPWAVRDRMYRMSSVCSMPSPSRFSWAELAEEEEMGLLSPLPPLPANYYGDDGDDENEAGEGGEGNRAVASSSSAQYEYHSYSTSDHYNVSCSSTQYHYVSTHDEPASAHWRGEGARRGGSRASEDLGAREPMPGGLRRSRENGRKGSQVQQVQQHASRAATMSAPALSSVLQVACDAAAAAERICRAMRESEAMRSGHAAPSSASASSSSTNVLSSSPVMSHLSGMARSASTSKVNAPPAQAGGSSLAAGRKKGSAKDARGGAKSAGGAPAGERRSGSATNLVSAAGIPAGMGAGLLRAGGRNRSDAALSWRRETPPEGPNGGLSEGAHPRVAGMVAGDGGHMSRSASASQVCSPSQRQLSAANDASGANGSGSSSMQHGGGSNASQMAQRRARRNSLTQQLQQGGRGGSGRDLAGSCASGDNAGGSSAPAANSGSRLAHGAVGLEVSSHTGMFRGMSIAACPIMVLAEHWGEDEEDELEDEEDNLGVAAAKEEESKGKRGEGKRGNRRGQCREGLEGEAGEGKGQNRGCAPDGGHAQAGDDEEGFITVTRESRRLGKGAGNSNQHNAIPRKGSSGSLHKSGSNSNLNTGSGGNNVSNNKNNNNNAGVAGAKRGGEGGGITSKMSASAAIFVPGLVAAAASAVGNTASNFVGSNAAANAAAAAAPARSATDLPRPWGTVEAAAAGPLDTALSSSRAPSPGGCSSPSSGSSFASALGSRSGSWADAEASPVFMSPARGDSGGGDTSKGSSGSSPGGEGGQDAGNEGACDGWEQVSHGRKKGAGVVGVKK